MDSSTNLLNRSRCGDECLSSNLSTEDTLAIFVRAATTKDIDFDLFNIQERNEIRKWLLC
jgi:hypothetical protein